MAENEASLKTVFTRTTPEGQKYEPTDKIAGIGGVFGVIAALVGLLTFVLPDTLPAGSILPLPFQTIQIFESYQATYLFTTIFLGLLAVGFLLQAKATKKLSLLLESGYARVLILCGVILLFGTLIVYSGSSVDPTKIVDLRGYLSNVALAGALIIIIWQLTSVIYVDSSKSYYGLLAGICNGFFWPLLAVGFASATLYTIVVPVAYLVLLVGQLFIIVYWWLPQTHIREFARSSETAKFGFGITGFLTFLIGAVAIFNGAITTVEGAPVWNPWSVFTTYHDPILVTGADFLTPPWVVGAFIASLLFWVLLAPRLGVAETTGIQVQESIIKGGIKWFMVFLAVIGIFSSVESSTLAASAANGLAIFLVVVPGGIMFLVGAAYMGTNDVITGLPLIVSSVFIMTAPYVLEPFVTIPWQIIIATQFLLMIETKIRGHTAFSQTILTVIATMVASILFIAFMLGLFGAGPPAIWPANQWFNISLFAGIPIKAQAPTILALVILTLLVRNVAVVGYTRGARQASADILGTMSFLFAMMIVIIAGAKDFTHQALTAAAIVFMLYTISFVLVLSLNLDLGSRILKMGHELEGNLIRITAAVGLLFGAAVAVYTFFIFGGFPTPLMIAGVITLLITLVVGLEILSIIGWLSAAIRLGFFTGGFKFYE